MILNLIKKRQEGRRQKRWVSRQLPLEDVFLDGIKSVDAPDLRQRLPAEKNLQPQQKIVSPSDLLTRINSVPQRQMSNQMIPQR